MASRGWVYSDQDTAGLTKRYHPDCDCQIVPGWGEHPSVAGYDPGRFEAMYRQSVVLTSDDTVDRVSTLAKMRDMFPGEITDGHVVPSILREYARGWPEHLDPMSKKTWLHIIGKHGADAAPRKGISRFEGMTNYEIAEHIVCILKDPVLRVRSPNRHRYWDNHGLLPNGQEMLVGTCKLEGRKEFVVSAFPAVDEVRKRLT